jgi:hypothetical protein
MTVDDLVAKLKQYPPHMKVFTYNAKGQIQEVRSAESLSGDDEAWHEKQAEDVLFIS